MTKVNYKKNYNQCSYFNDKLRIVIEVNWEETKLILKSLVTKGEPQLLSK
jgi:hypothetical protein